MGIVGGEVGESCERKEECGGENLPTKEDGNLFRDVWRGLHNTADVEGDNQWEARE